MRTELLAAITEALYATPQFAVSQELPWAQNGTPLYLKNFKKVYVDRPTLEESTLIPVLSGSDVMSDDLTCSVYLACDAKNPPSQLDTAIANILSAKNGTGLVNVVSDYSFDKQEDVLIYTFEFRMNTIT